MLDLLAQALPDGLLHGLRVEFGGGRIGYHETMLVRGDPFPGGRQIGCSDGEAAVVAVVDQIAIAVPCVDHDRISPPSRLLGRESQ